MKLSIITINLNNASGLRKTIRSVVSQTFSDFEYIIIDGGSTDGSVDVIKEYSDIITYWVSEPDKGIYNAMNKGIVKANGEYCLLLNSGDWLIDKDVVFDFYRYNSKEDVISGNVLLWEKDNTVLWESVQNDSLSYELFFYSTLPHQASFLKRGLFREYGLYNENNFIASDWEFFFKVIVIYNCTYNHFNRVITCFDLTGISSQDEWRLIQKKERETILKTNLPLVYKSFLEKCFENENFRLHESEYREYMNLKNGKFSIFIRLFLWIKKWKNYYRNV